MNNWYVAKLVNIRNAKKYVILGYETFAEALSTVSYSFFDKLLDLKNVDEDELNASHISMYFEDSEDLPRWYICKSECFDNFKKIIRQHNIEVINRCQK